MTGVMQTTFYFGYMLIFCIGVGLVTGAPQLHHLSQLYRQLRNFCDALILLSKIAC